MINLPKIKKLKLVFFIFVVVFCFSVAVILALGMQQKLKVQISTQLQTGQVAKKVTKPTPLIKFGGENQISATQLGSFFLEVVPTQELQALVYRLEILFDPKLLIAQGVKAGPFFKNPKILRQEIDNKTGRIYFSTGISPEEITETGQPKTTKVLAILSFKVRLINNLNAPTQTTVSFGEKTLIVGKETKFENFNLVLKPIIIVISNKP